MPGLKVRVNYGGELFEMDVDNGALVREVFARVGADATQWAVFIGGRRVTPETGLANEDEVILTRMPSKNGK